MEQKPSKKESKDAFTPKKTLCKECHSTMIYKVESEKITYHCPYGH